MLQRGCLRLEGGGTLGCLASFFHSNTHTLALFALGGCALFRRFDCGFSGGLQWRWGVPFLINTGQ